MNDQPRMVMVFKVRDEADILETNLRYHAAQGVDFFIATDNGSSDGTLDILRAWEASGVLHLIERPKDSYNEGQQQWATEMARLAATDHGADWVLHNDADQFWWPLQGSLREAIAEVPARYGVVTAPKVDFVGRSDGPGSFSDRLTVRDAYTPIAPTIAHRGREDVVVIKGSHAVDVEAARRGEQAYSLQRATYRPLSRSIVDPPLPPQDPLVPAPVFPVRIFHFPLRSSAQYERRLRAYFGGGYEPGVVGRLRKRLDIEGIAALYDELVLDDAEVEAGIREGRLVRDERLRDFLAHLDDPSAPAPQLSGEDLRSEIEDVRFDALAGLGRMQRSLFARRDQARAREGELQREVAAIRRKLRRARRRTPWRRLRRWIRRRWRT